MDTVVIRCKGCGALFYANARLEPEDVLDIVKYAKEGHTVSVVDAAVVRTELATCTCKGDHPITLTMTEIELDAIRLESWRKCAEKICYFVQEDGTCLHPHNPTPECHEAACPAVLLDAAVSALDERDRQSDAQDEQLEAKIRERRENCTCPICGDSEYHKDGCEIGKLEVEVEGLREALTLILDMVDYTAGNCRLNELVGAVLPKGVIEQARGVLQHQ